MDAYVLLRTEPGSTRSAAERLTRLAGDGIRQVVVITGDWDVLVALDVADPHQLGEVVMGQVLDDEAIIESQTAVVVAPPARDPVPKPKPKPKPMPVRGRDPFVALVFAELDRDEGRESADDGDVWLANLMDSIGETTGVAGAALITGEHDLLVEIGGQTWEECSAGILSVGALPGIVRTTTAVAVTEKLVPAD